MNNFLEKMTRCDCQQSLYTQVFIKFYPQTFFTNSFKNSFHHIKANISMAVSTVFNNIQTVAEMANY